MVYGFIRTYISIQKIDCVNKFISLYGRIRLPYIALGITPTYEKKGVLLFILEITMTASLRSIAASLAFVFLTPLNTYANVDEIRVDIQNACEEEAQGQDNPETYVKQCVEEMLTMLKEEDSTEVNE